MADQTIKRGNLHDVRKQINDRLTDLDDRVTYIETVGGSAPSGGIVLAYTFVNTQSGDPGTGNVATNDPDPLLSTEIRVSVTNGAGNHVGVLMQNLNAGDWIGMFEKLAPNSTGFWSLTAAGIDHGTYFEFPVALVDTDPALPANGGEIDLYLVASAARLLPPGGDTGDILEKVSADDYDAGWVDGSTKFLPAGTLHDSLGGIGPNNHHNQVHLLYGTDHSDVETAIPKAERMLLALKASGKFGLEYRANWAGVWGPQTYQRDDMVYDPPYTMIANKETNDRAAPQNLGLPEWGFITAPLFNTQSDTAVIFSGHRYLFNEEVKVEGIRVWVPAAGGDINYRVGYVVNPQTDPIYHVINNPEVTPNKWNTVVLDSRRVPAGTELDVILESYHSNTNQQFTGNWDYAGVSNGTPGGGDWNHNAAQTVVKVNKTDVALADRESDLMTLATGSTLHFVDTLNPDKWIEYRVNQLPSNEVNHVEYVVTIINQGPAGAPTTPSVTLLTGTKVVSILTEYSELPGHWATQPAWGTASSLLFYDDVDQNPPPDTGFGVDIKVQRIVASPDWDFVAVSSSGGGGGEEGTPFPEAPSDGQLYGRNGFAQDWEPTYRTSEADAKFQPINDWKGWTVTQDDVTAAWDAWYLMPTPPNTVQLPPPDQPVVGVTKDIVIWNASNDNLLGPDQPITVVPATGTFFVIDGQPKALNQPVIIKPGEVGRIATRVQDDSYVLSIEAPGLFDGPGTFGLVRDPVTSSGKFLSDSGTWQSIIVPPQAGALQLEYFWSVSVAGAPGIGYAAMNDVNPAFTTEIHVNKTTKNGNTLELLWPAILKGDVIWFIDELNGVGYAFRVNGVYTDNGAWVAYGVDDYYADGFIADGAGIKLAVTGNPNARVPPGGTENQLLAKASSNDYDSEWQTVTVIPEPPQNGLSYTRYWTGSAFDWGTVNVKFTGPVGIGTTDPLDPLHVMNSLRVARSATQYTVIDNSTATGGIIKSISAANNGKPQVFDCLTPDGSDYTVGTRGYTFRSQESVGGVIRVLYNIAHYINNSVQHLWSNATKELMRLTDEGRLGIGTTDPQEPLHVAGDGRFDGNLNIGATTTNDRGKVFIKSNDTLLLTDAMADKGLVLASGYNPNGAGPHVGLGFGVVTSENYVSNMIAAVQGNGTNWYQNDLAFYTHPVSGSGQALEEKVRFKYDGKVGIGTTDPATKLHVSIGSAAMPTLGLADIFVAQGDVGGNAYISVVSDAAYKSGIRFSDTVFARGQIAYDHADDSMSFNTNGGERVRIDSAGKVGIGTPSPLELLDIRGNVRMGTNLYLMSQPNNTNYWRISPNISDTAIFNLRFYAGATLAGSITPAGDYTSVGNVIAYSDARLKHNLEPIDNALEKVGLLTGYTFDRTDVPGRHTGLIAQDVEKVLPEAVTESEDGTKGLAYGNLVGLLVQAVKELHAEVDYLRSELERR